LEKKRMRDLDDCDEIYQLSQITDEKTCYNPLALCIAYAVQSKKINILNDEKPLVKISMAKLK